MRRLILLFAILLTTTKGECRAETMGSWQDAGNYETNWYSDSENTFSISTNKQLAGLAYLVNEGKTFSGKEIVLNPESGNEIDLSEHFWVPIGLETKSFHGSLNGNGCTVKGIQIGTENNPIVENYAGFINRLVAEKNGDTPETIVIKDLTVEGEIIHNRNNGCTGGLLGGCTVYGNSSITIENCINKVIIRELTFGHDGKHGGLIGSLDVHLQGNITLINCGNLALVTAENAASGMTGGLIGRCSGNVQQDVNIKIEACYNRAPVYGAQSASTGGLIGSISFWHYVRGNPGNGTFLMNNCFNNAPVQGGMDQWTRTGGLIGALIGSRNGTGTIDMNVTNCYSNGSISATGGSSLGGLVGIFSITADATGSITDCYVAGEVIGQSSPQTGGLVGYLEKKDDCPPPMVKNCLVALNNLEGTSVKRAIGYIESSDKILNEEAVEALDMLDNYAYVKTQGAAGLTNSLLPEGADWKGIMSAAPVNTWDTNVWTIDPSGSSLPKLANSPQESQQENVPNPFVSSSPAPSEYHTVTLEVGRGIDLLTYTTGEYYVEDGEHMYFQFLPEDREATAEHVLFQVDSIETKFKDFGGNYYFSYILNPIREARSVQITMKEYGVSLPDQQGVTIDVGPGTHQVLYGDPFSFSLTFAGSIDPAEIHVYANGEELQPENLHTESLHYMISKVTGPIQIKIEGYSPVANSSINNPVRIYPVANGLQIETDQPLMVSVYNTLGALVTTRMVTGKETISLPQGIYIVRIEKEACKVIVR